MIGWLLSITAMTNTPCKSQLLHRVSAPNPSFFFSLHYSSRVHSPMLRCLATCSRSTLKTRSFMTNGPTTLRISTTRFHKQLPGHSNLLPRSTLTDRLALYSTKAPNTTSSSNAVKNNAAKLTGSNIEAVASQSNKSAATNDTKDIKRLFQLAKPEIKSISGKIIIFVLDRIG